MTDNGGGRQVTRMIRTHDLVSGDELLIVYFPRAGVVTINGYSVTRSPELEDSEGVQSMFHRGIGNKLYSVSIDSLTQLYV